MQEESVTTLHSLQDTLSQELALVGNAEVAASPPPVTATSTHHRSRRDAPSLPRGERRDASAGAGPRRDARERRRSKEPPTSEYLRALLHLQQRDAATSVGEAPAVFSVSPSRGVNENLPESTPACAAGAPAFSVPNIGLETQPRGQLENSLLGVLGAAAATATVASAPSIVAPPNQGDAEAIRRRTLFEIQRLMLEARPYDSIEFFHVQRELVKYLGLEPQRRASVTDYIMTMGLSQRIDGRAPALAAGTGAVPGPGAGTGPTPESEGIAATASRASSAPSCTRSAPHAPGFWKRLRSRWRRGGGGSTGDEFKGEGDMDVGEALRKP